MKIFSRMLLASVLAIGAAAFAGCADADCPETLTPGAACSSPGLSCFYPGTNGGSCGCTSGVWSCTFDMPFPLERDMSMRDMTESTD